MPRQTRQSVKMPGMTNILRRYRRVIEPAQAAFDRLPERHRQVYEREIAESIRRRTSNPSSMINHGQQNEASQSF